MKRPQPYRLAFAPSTSLDADVNDKLARQFSNADQMFDILFKDFGNRAAPAGGPFAPLASPAFTGNVAIGVVAPTARLHLPAGAAAAGLAPLKLEPGTLLTAPELGAVEFTDDGTNGHLYITLNVAGVLTRVQIV